MLTAFFGKPERNVEAQFRIEKAVDGYVDAHHARLKNSVFLREFKAIQAWQTRRLLLQYDHLFICPKTATAAQFMLHEVYSGDHLSLISEEIQKTARKAWRLVPADMVDAAANALETNYLTAKIDDEIALFCTQQGGLQFDFGSNLYLQALRHPTILQQRRLQLRQFAMLSESIKVYLKRKSVRYGLKMTSGIAQRAGVLNLHQFLSKACDVLRSAQDISIIVKEVTTTELALLDQIELGHNPFKFMDMQFSKSLKQPVITD